MRLEGSRDVRFRYGPSAIASRSLWHSHWSSSAPCPRRSSVPSPWRDHWGTKCVDSGADLRLALYLRLERARSPPCQGRLKSGPPTPVEKWTTCGFARRLKMPPPWWSARPRSRAGGEAERAGVSVACGGGGEVLVPQPVAVSLEGQDLGVVDEPVDHRRGDDLVAEDLAPARERLVRGDDHRGPLVARRDQAEHQVRRLGVEGDVADLVDDDQRHEAEPAQLGLEVAGALRVAEPRHPLGRGGEGDPVAGQAGAERERDRQMRLAGAGRVGVALLMLSIRCRSGCGWSRRRGSCGASSSRCVAGRLI